MKFRAVQIGRDGDTRAIGEWHRRYPMALADCRRDVAPFKRTITWGVEDQHGNVREISETQWERGIDEYHEAIATRDAVGVWG